MIRSVQEIMSSFNVAEYRFVVVHVRVFVLCLTWSIVDGLSITYLRDWCSVLVKWNQLQSVRGIIAAFPCARAIFSLCMSNTKYELCRKSCPRVCLVEFVEFNTENTREALHGFY